MIEHIIEVFWAIANIQTISLMAIGIPGDIIRFDHVRACDGSVTAIEGAGTFGHAQRSACCRSGPQRAARAINGQRATLKEVPRSEHHLPLIEVNVLCWLREVLGQKQFLGAGLSESDRRSGVETPPQEFCPCIPRKGTVLDAACPACFSQQVSSPWL